MRWIFVAAVLMSIGCGDVDGPRIETLGFTAPAVPLRITGPGSVRLGVVTRFTDVEASQVDLSSMTLTTTGPLTATWELGAMGFRAVDVVASEPGTGTVTISYGGKSASISVDAQAVQFKSVSLTTGYGCGLALDDTAWCWGGNFDGALGVNTLGRCSGSACQYPANDGNPTPLPVDGGRKYVQVATAGQLCVTTFSQGICGRTCALTAAGETWCWGGGSSTATRMAQDLTLASLTMRQGADAPLTPTESCGLTVGGQAYCFTANASAPVQAMGFEAYQAGIEHSCGITNGDVYCWGGNRHANLGIGSADTEAHADPVKVSTTAKFTEVGVGRTSTCALDTTGVVQCWGYVGSASTQTVCDPGNSQCVITPQPATGGTAYTTMAQSTGGPLVCAAKDAAVDCWTDFTKAPQHLTIPEPVVSISVAGQSCVVSITNELYCWDSSFVVKKFP